MSENIEELELEEEYESEEMSIEEVGEAEVKMIRGATAAYIAKGNPKPIRVPVTFGLILRKYGAYSVSLVASLLGGMYLSSLRVGILMEIQQVNTIATFVAKSVGNFDFGNPFVARWGAMLAFEGALLSFGLREGESAKEMTFSKWALYVSLAVTIVAGVLFGLQLDDKYPVWTSGLTTLFSVLSGLGAPVVVIFSSLNVGYLLKELFNLPNTHTEDWMERLEEWKKGFNEYYPYYAGQLHGVERRHKLKKFDEGVLQQTTTKKVVVNPNSNGSTKKVRDHLKELGYKPSDVGGEAHHRLRPAQLARDTGVPESQIHTYLYRLKQEEKQGKWNI